MYLYVSTAETSFMLAIQMSIIMQVLTIDWLEIIKLHVGVRTGIIPTLPPDLLDLIQYLQ